MASSQCSEDSLNDSWVELQFQQKQMQQGLSVDVGPALGKSLPLSLPPSTMEKLLLEAQREFSASSSRIGSATASTAASSRGSPKSPHSPCADSSSSLGLLSEVSSLKVKEVPQSAPPEATDWIWEWSSRPEAQPPSGEWGSKLKHPHQHKLSARKMRVMNAGVFSLENLPILIFTHACTFFLGAATMFFFLKKYCKWAPLVSPLMD